MNPSSVRTRVLAPVMEVFASIQGEGAYVGQPQVLVRLAGCPLRCRWCDTPSSWSLDADASARVAAQGGVRSEESWATPFQVACWIAEVEPGDPRPVSVTGGEPTQWPDFLRGLRGVCGDRRLHLETAGGHPEALAAVLDVFDHISLDVKLPADLDEPVELVRDALDEPWTQEGSPRGEDEWARARGRCLDLVAGRDAAVKLVVAGGREPDDYDEILLDVARRAPRLPFYLQPATPVGGVAAPSEELLVGLIELARERGLDVRVLPQVHRALRVR